MTTDPKIGALYLRSMRESCVLHALAAAICSEVARQCLNAFGERLRAVVLTGSLARDEASFNPEGSGWKLLGDAEFLLVFHPHVALPGKSATDAVRQSIEQNLLNSKLECRIDLNTVHPQYLRRLPPSIFTYELRTCGQVIWGERQILSLVPTFSSTEIRLEDAWRLLCNRMIELLEAASELGQDGSKHPLGPLYRTAKFYLDMATSFLVFAGGYAPTYREREQNLRRLTEDTTRRGEWPFELAPFAKQVTSCTEWKLAAYRSGSQPLRVSWQEAISFARALWRWELETLMGSRRDSLSDRELLLRWMRFQPSARRLRGWLYVARKCGWHRSWRHWLRWARRAWRASPRHWVYAAAGELLFRLPSGLGSTAQPPTKDDHLQELQSWLPFSNGSQSGDGLPRWQQLAREIGWNYHQFLEKTRA